jgi:prepilin-type N-terminal cleavage/methylation domain-containing protein
MSFRQPSTIISKNGMTLIELMVSVAIFLSLMGMVLGLLHQNQSASEKSISQADASASALLVFEKVRQEIRNGRVVGNELPGVLDYWIYQRSGTAPVFGGLHGLVYLPGPDADPDVAQLKLEDGRLIREFQGVKKMFVPLGEDGDIVFNWDQGSHLVLISGQISDPFDEPQSKSPPRKFKFLLSLNNVE